MKLKFIGATSQNREKQLMSQQEAKRPFKEGPFSLFASGTKVQFSIRKRSAKMTRSLPALGGFLLVALLFTEVLAAKKLTRLFDKRCVGDQVNLPAYISTLQ